MDAVTLRGRKEGFELNIDAGADFDQALDSIVALLSKIRSEQPKLGNDKIELELTTGMRLLSEQQKKALYQTLEPFPEFDIMSIKNPEMVKNMLSDMVEEERAKKRVAGREFMVDDTDDEVL